MSKDQVIARGKNLGLYQLEPDIHFDFAFTNRTDYDNLFRILDDEETTAEEIATHFKKPHEVMATSYDEKNVMEIMSFFHLSIPNESFETNIAKYTNTILRSNSTLFVSKQEPYENDNGNTRGRFCCVVENRPAH